MLIEIRGAGFVNKGAELMLRTIQSRLAEALPCASFSIDPWGNPSPYLDRCRIGLYQKLWLRKFGIQWGYFGALIPKRLRSAYGMVLDSELDVVLDASGFAYADHWGPYQTQIAAKAAKKWKKQGTKVVFLPQAFGPFKSRQIRSALNTIVEYADLVFARDRLSYGYMVDVTGKRNNIKIAPDFTNLLDGELPEDFDTKKNRFCIIPNYRMIDMTSDKRGNSYIDFMRKCVKHIHDRGKSPFILIHEEKDDLDLCRRIVNAVGEDISIVCEKNSLYVKGIIGASEAVISSRFHGLVSALSQGIPALGTGWSHKYTMLFEDYGFKEGLISPELSHFDLHNRLEMVISESRRNYIIDKIVTAAKVQKNASVQMWNMILSLLEC